MNRTKKPLTGFLTTVASAVAATLSHDGCADRGPSPDQMVARMARLLRQPFAIPRLACRCILPMMLVGFRCGSDQPPPPAELGSCEALSPERTTPEAARLVPIDSLHLPTSGEVPVLGVRSLRVSPAGDLLLVDSRSNNLKLVEDGRATRAIGRSGEGPGEFAQLFDAAFLSEDRIIALDAGASRASVFEISSGTVVSSFQLSDHEPRSVLPLDSSTIMIGGLLADGSDHLVGIYSLDGVRHKSFFPAEKLLFDTNLVVDDVWLAPLTAELVAVGLALTPSVHSYSISGEFQCTETTTLPSWSQLLPPREPLNGLPAMRAWIGEATLGVQVVSSGRRLYRQYGYSQGDRFIAEYTDALTFVQEFESPTGTLVGADESSLYFVHNESLDDVTIVRYGRLPYRPTSCPGR